MSTAADDPKKDGSHVAKEVISNQTARFICGTDATLTVALRRTAKQIRVTVRFRDDGEKSKAKVIRKQYFDLKEENPAQDAYNELVKDAKRKNWELQEPARKSASLDIPVAPEPKARTGTGTGPQAMSNRTGGGRQR